MFFVFYPIEVSFLNKNKIVDLANKKALPFDQLIALEKEEENAYPIRIFNPDGIEVAACGNGVRCVAYLIFQENKQKRILIKTKYKKNLTQLF